MAQYDINLREYWRILKKRKTIVVITALLIGFFSTSFSILNAPTPIYTSFCSVKFEKDTAVEGLYVKTLAWSGSDDMETQISIINSFSVFERVAQKMGLIPDRPIKEGHLKSNIIRIVIGLQSKVEVTREKFTNIINITAKDENPSFAQKLANTIALTYKELHSERQMKRTIEALKYIKTQLETVQGKLREAEAAFNKFSHDNQLISIDLQSENLLMRNQETQSEIRKIQKYIMELESISSRVDRFIREPSGSDNDFYSEKINGRYQAASANLMELLLKRDTLLEDYTPEHPELIGIGRKILEIARKMLILLRVEIRDAEIQEIDQLNELRSIKKKTDLLMERKIEFDRRKRRVEYYRDMTGLLEEKNQEALIRKAEKPEEITLVRPALLPTAPVNPPKTATTGAIGLVMGMILGLVAALVVETFDTSLGAIEDVEQTIGAPVLGVIPHVDAKQIQLSLREKFPHGVEDLPQIMQSPYVISHFAPMSIIAESYRALRTGIQFKKADQPIKSIGFTSASPQEGKTFVSINFSITMAQAGMKVLLVEADMRKPMLSKAFGLANTPGLSDILIGSYSWRDSLKTITDIIMGKMGLEGAMITPGLDNLHIISSGAIPPNPAELIESKGIGDFVKEAGSNYDILVFDAPPILSTADAAIIANKMDGVLLVYRVGTVSRGLLKRSATQLEQAKSQILGVILNGMRPEISPDFHDFRYYKYDYAHRSRAEGKKHGKSFWGKRASSGKSEAPSKTETMKGAMIDQGKQGSGKWKAAAGIMALALLVSGILWQNGILNPFNRPGLDSPIQEKSNGSSSRSNQVKAQRDPGSDGKRVVLEGKEVLSPVVFLAEDQERFQGEQEASSRRENPSKIQKEPEATKERLNRVKPGFETKGKVEEDKTPSEASADEGAVREKPGSSPLKSLAAKFWKRTVKDIKTSIHTGKSESQSKIKVTITSTDEAEKSASKTTPDFRSGIKVTGDGKAAQVQITTVSSEKMASKPNKEQAKKSKTADIGTGVISAAQADREEIQTQFKRIYPKMIRAKTSKIRWWEGEGSDFHLLTGSEWNGPGVNDEEFNHPIPRTSFPKRIRAKTIKYRAPGSSMAMARINSGSAWKVPIVGDKDGARHQEASSMGIIASKTEMEQEDMAQAPLLPSLPEETGMRGIKVSAHLQKRNSYPYSLYLGSFRTTARAERAMAVYRKNGFRPYLTRVEFKERGVWFRVYGGYFKDSVQAESYKEKHHLLEAKVRKTNFANLVGTYSDQKALKDNMSRLESMGYHPYVIKGVDGRSSLFLGAYVTETGAVKQNQDLKSKGISVEVIRR